jgi:hypothetical protein
MPLSKSFILSVLITLAVIGCSRNQDATPFEFCAHNLKFKYDSTTHLLSVADTITLNFNRNVDHIYFFLHDSLHVTRISIGNQELIPVPVSPRHIQTLPVLTEKMAKVLDRAQIVQVPIPKSLFPKRIKVWYSGNVDSRDLSEIAWHPILPGGRTDFQLTALLPAEFKPAENNILSLQNCEDAWCLWTGQTSEPKQFCDIPFLISEATNPKTSMN